MAGKMNSLAMYPVNTHSKPYVNGAQNAHVSTGAVAIAPAGGTEARAGVCEAIMELRIVSARCIDDKYLRQRYRYHRFQSTDTNGST